MTKYCYNIFLLEKETFRSDKLERVNKRLDQQKLMVEIKKKKLYNEINSHIMRITIYICGVDNSINYYYNISVIGHYNI